MTSFPTSRNGNGYAGSEGAFASWLGVRCTRTPALYFRFDPLLRLLRRQVRTRGDAWGSPRGGLWSA
jgi:hypothetical protein